MQPNSYFTLLFFISLLLMKKMSNKSGIDRGYALHIDGPSDGIISTVKLIGSELRLKESSSTNSVLDIWAILSKVRAHWRFENSMCTPQSQKVRTDSADIQGIICACMFLFSQRERNHRGLKDPLY